MDFSDDPAGMSLAGPKSALVLVLRPLVPFLTLFGPAMLVSLTMYASHFAVVLVVATTIALLQVAVFLYIFFRRLYAEQDRAKKVRLFAGLWIILVANLLVAVAIRRGMNRDFETASRSAVYIAAEPHL